MTFRTIKDGTVTTDLKGINRVSSVDILDEIGTFYADEVQDLMAGSEPEYTLTPDCIGVSVSGFEKAEIHNLGDYETIYFCIIEVAGEKETAAFWRMDSAQKWLSDTLFSKSEA